MRIRILARVGELNRRQRERDPVVGAEELTVPTPRAHCLRLAATDVTSWRDAKIRIVFVEQRTPDISQAKGQKSS